MIEARKPEPEPGWASSLWPKPMTRERIFLEARLNSWTYLLLALLVCFVIVGIGIFFVWSSLYGNHPYQPFRGLLIGTLLAIVFSFLELYVVVVMIAKYIMLPPRNSDPNYQKIDRLLPIRSKKSDA